MSPRRLNRRTKTSRSSSISSLVKSVKGTLGPLIASRRKTILAFGRWVGLIAIVLAIVLTAWNLLIRFEHRSSSQDQDIVLFASYPRYLPTEDQGGIVITVLNTGQQPITGTVVSLVCGNAQYVCMDFDSTSRVVFGRLEPKERKTRLVKFQVNRISSFVQKVRIDLELSAQHSTTLTDTLRVEPTVISFLPVGVTSLILKRTFTIPNLLVALGAIVALVKSVTETRKALLEMRTSGSRGQSTS